MPAINEGSWRDVAKRRFPRTPPSRIRGSGQYALAFRDCWRVDLYATKDAMLEAYAKYQYSSCGARVCNPIDHLCVNLGD